MRLSGRLHRRNEPGCPALALSWLRLLLLLEVGEHLGGDVDVLVPHADLVGLLDARLDRHDVLLLDGRGELLSDLVDGLSDVDVVRVAAVPADPARHVEVMDLKVGARALRISAL